MRLAIEAGGEDTVQDGWSAFVPNGRLYLRSGRFRVRITRSLGRALVFMAGMVRA